MRRMTYTQHFRGRLTPVGPGLADVEAAGGPTPLGEAATLLSQLVFVGERSFREVGTIAFGGEPALRFATVAPGDLGEAPDPALRHGTAALDVWGVGALDGARGRITSNFVVGADGALVDEQLVVLFVRTGDEMPA